MEEKVHVMVDLETIGNDPSTGPLIAIGAVAFTIEEPIYYPDESDFDVCARFGKFYYPIDLVGQYEQYGFVNDYETFHWWLAKERYDQLLAFLNSPHKIVLREAFDKFAWWVASVCPNQKNLALWSHGVTYDCMHLSKKWPIVVRHSFNKVCPFRQMYDTRTIFSMFEEKHRHSPYPEIKRDHHHHPLEDAWVQATAVQTAWKGLVYERID